MIDKTIYIIRHGETDFNRLGIVQGQGVDTTLNSLGHQQAHAFYKHYQHLPFEAVLTSALQRTHQTVAPFIKKNIPWEQFHDINEINWGIHEGKPGNAEMRETYKRLMTAWNSGQFEAKIEKGESAAELGARVKRFVQHLQKREESLLLVCAHGRTMRALICILKEISLTEMDRFNHNNTGLWQVKQSGSRFEFLIENDTTHLEPFKLKQL